MNLVPFSLEVINLNNIPELLKEDKEVIYAPVIGFERHHYHGIKYQEEDTPFKTD